MKYRVVWQRKDNPNINGRGSAVLDKETAQSWVDYANKAFSFLVHWMELVSEGER